MVAKSRYVNTPTIMVEAEQSSPGYERNLTGKEVDLIKEATKVKQHINKPKETEAPEPTVDEQQDVVKDDTPEPEQLEGNEALFFKIYNGMGYQGAEGFVSTIKAGTNQVIQWVKDVFKWVIELFTSKTARAKDITKKAEIKIAKGEYVAQDTPLDYHPSIFDLMDQRTEMALPVNPVNIDRRIAGLKVFANDVDHTLSEFVSGWKSDKSLELVENDFIQLLIKHFNISNGKITLFDNFEITVALGSANIYRYRSKAKVFKRRVIKDKQWIFKIDAFKSMQQHATQAIKSAENIDQHLSRIESLSISVVKTTPESELNEVRNRLHNIMLIARTLLDTVVSANRAVGIVLEKGIK